MSEELKELMRRQRELSLELAIEDLTLEDRRAKTETLRDITAAIEACLKERELGVEEDKAKLTFFGEVAKAVGGVATAGVTAFAAIVLGTRALNCEQKDILPISKAIPFAMKLIK